MSAIDYSKFTDLTYDDFRAMAKDGSLTDNEKIGFPDSYRDGFEPAILANIRRHLPQVEEKGSIILDLGCGCSLLTKMLIDQCGEKKNTLLLADSEEMLSHLPKQEWTRHIAGHFPDSFASLGEYHGKINAIIVYSVLQHVVINGSVHRFLDAALNLLAPGGRLLLADIPNISKRDRFFSSDAGVAFHQNFTKDKSLPQVELLKLKPHKVDDGIVMGLMHRYRNFGFETYLLPQPSDLPMHNRREDLLIVKW